MATEHKDTTWRAVLAPTTKFLVLTATNPYVAANALSHFGDSPNLHYFLSVINSKVDVLFGLRRCLPLHRNRWALLRGDIKLLHGVQVYPQMLRLNGARTLQDHMFTPVDRPAMSMADIETAVAANPNEFAPRAPPGTEIQAWQLMPVHPKIACLSLVDVAYRIAWKS
jgi:hypothetical protein